MTMSNPQQAYKFLVRVSVSVRVSLAHTHSLTHRPITLVHTGAASAGCEKHAPVRPREQSAGDLLQSTLHTLAFRHVPHADDAVSVACDDC